MARKWYAVQEDCTSAWDYGSYDYYEAVDMLISQGHGLIAVIEETENPVCVDEIKFEDIQ